MAQKALTDLNPGSDKIMAARVANIMAHTYFRSGSIGDLMAWDV